MIDLHTHVLAGIDDGPVELSQSLQLAREALGAGIQTLVATPHVSWSYPDNDSAAIAAALARLRARMKEERIPLQVLPGAEVAVTRIPEMPAAELARLTLGGGRWLLIEFPLVPGMDGLEEIVGLVQGRGLRVLLAHVERCAIFQHDPAILRELVEDRGCLCSVTAGSLVGFFGESVRRFALALFREGLVHNVASDAHDPAHRRPSLAEELDRAGLHDLTPWLTQDVPAAILAGTAIPPPPPAQLPQAPVRDRGWLARLRPRP